VLPGTLAENEIAPEVEKVKAIILENGGENLEVGESDKRRLAYPVKQIRYGYFLLAYFTAEAKAVKTIEAKLRLMPELLRALVYKYSPKAKKAKKIDFGLLAAGEERRPEVAFVPMAAAPAVEEFKEVVVMSEEKKKLEAAPVKKAWAKKESKKKVDLDEIDKKLDEILDMGLDNV